MQAEGCQLDVYALGPSMHFQQQLLLKELRE
jgi:hypothetical protein